MAANFFQQKAYDQLIHRLDQLQAISTRQWGTMTPAEMLRHCRSQIDFILDPRPIKVYQTPLRFAPIRWITLYGPAWPKNSPTAPEMDVTKKLKDTSAFETEKTLLKQALNQLKNNNRAAAIHPLFGYMTTKLWGRVIWKHLDHHLRQFAC